MKAKKILAKLLERFREGGHRSCPYCSGGKDHTFGCVLFGRWFNWERTGHMAEPDDSVDPLATADDFVVSP